jgi:hypothetical protein
VTEKPKRQPTTISRKKFDELEVGLKLAKERAYDLSRKAEARREERDEALSRADEQTKMVEIWRDRALAAENRASRAEGYASALLDRQHPARPETPWEKPDVVDQWGNRILK